MKELPIAPLSLDLDNAWSFLKVYGREGWRTAPSYLELVVPRVLDHLDQRDWEITFFVVGRDADAEPDVIQALSRAGHEVANHSYVHNPWLHDYSIIELHEEMEKAEDAITSATGVPPVGFRGPGYSLSSQALKVLAERGYRYDASVFRNLAAPAARLYFFRHATLTIEERHRLRFLFGSLRQMRLPNTFFTWDIAFESSLAELPVTTVPFLGLPFHFSYLIHLGTFSQRLAQWYLETAIWLCQRTGTTPSLLLHPLDFLGESEAPELEAFPGMKISKRQKLEILAGIFDVLAKHYRFVSLNSYLEDPNEGPRPSQRHTVLHA